MARYLGPLEGEEETSVELAASQNSQHATGTPRATTTLHCDTWLGSAVVTDFVGWSTSAFSFQHLSLEGTGGLD